MNILKILVLTILATSTSLIPETLLSNEKSKTFLVTSHEECKETKIIKEKTINNYITETKEVLKKNKIRVIGGVTRDSLKASNNNKSKLDPIPEDEILYGAGYDRMADNGLSVGVGYLRNKPNTTNVFLLDLGLSW